MIRRLAIRGLVLLGALVALLYGVSPVVPVAWAPPPLPELDGIHSPNRRLYDVDRLDTPGGEGPEDVAIMEDGSIVAGVVDGRLFRFDGPGGRPVVWTDTGGRPLGLHPLGEGRLAVADAQRGLLRVDRDGTVDVLCDEAGGQPIRFADDLDVASDGRVFFSDASARFGFHHWKDDIIESGGTGRLLVWSPETGTCTVLLAGLHFANGVALAPDERSVLVVETTRYRILRLWLDGPEAGEHEVFVDNLIAFPDGVSRGSNGRFWVGLVGPRNPLIDLLGPWPFVRRLIAALPEAVQPKPERHAWLLGLDGAGQVVVDMQDPDGTRFSGVSSVQEHGPWLYLGSLSEEAVGRVPTPR